MLKQKLITIIQNKKIWFLAGWVVAALLLRSWHYANFPVGGETADEYAWTLLGASLIQEKAPASWSYFPAYENYHYVEGVYDAPIVKPVFDHPPLFSLLPGIAQSLKADWLTPPSLKVIRLPLVILGALNVGIFWLVAQKIFSKKWAVLGTGLFLTIPSLVFGSRLVVAENLLVTWILLALLIVFQPTAGNRQHRWTMPLLILINLAAVLTKIAGFILPVSLIAYGLLSHRTKLAKAAAIGAVLGAGLFAFYGAIYNWQLFLAVLTDQSTRRLGLATLQNRLFLNPALVRHIFFDGWKVLGLFSGFWLISQTEKFKKMLLVPLLMVVTLLFIALTVGENTFHGWYDFILWPSLIISLTALLQQLWQTKNGLLFALVWLLLLPNLRLFFIVSGNDQALNNWLIRGLVVLGFLPLAEEIFHRQKLINKTIGLLLIVLLLVNIANIFLIDQQTYWLQAAFFEPVL